MREFQIVSGEKGSKKRGRRERKMGGKWQNEHEKRANQCSFDRKNAINKGEKTTLEIDVKS